MYESLFGINISRDSKDRVKLEVVDSISRDTVLKLDFSLEEYAKAITGLFGQSIEGQINLDANIAKRREIRSVRVPPDPNNLGENIKETVKFHFKQNYEPYGWLLHDDGMFSLQDSSLGHHYTIKRYVDVDDVMKFKKDH